jgi:hypothetical protein
MSDQSKTDTAATVTDETKFGTDEWGKWAEGVQNRLTALEQKAAAPAVAVSKGKGLSGGADLEARLAQLENVAGIARGPAVEEEKAAE